MNNEFPGYDLGSMSLGWEETDEFICKMHGMHGDIVIGWDSREY